MIYLIVDQPWYTYVGLGEQPEARAVSALGLIFVCLSKSSRGCIVLKFNIINPLIPVGFFV